MGQPVVEKRITLAPERAARLSAVAQAQGVSEEEIIQRLLDIFLSGAGVLAEEAERRAWQRLSEASLWRLWDNEQDAVYDNWGEIYGVPEG